MKTVLRAIFLLAALLVVGCTSTPLFVSGDQVSVYLAEKPEVKQTEFNIEFKFDSPTGDTHLVQRLELSSWSAEEAFRVTDGYKSYTDTHFSKGISYQHRRIVIRPGAVAGTDETFLGFSMLPGDWPDRFNEKYRWKKGKITDPNDPRFGEVVPDPQFGVNHKIQGVITYTREEHATVYLLTFDHGVLTWEIEGTDIKHVWRAEGK